MPLKTLHLTNSWHESSGGIATFYRALIEEANRRKTPIRLVVPGETDRIEEWGACGKIYYIASPFSAFNSRYRTIYPTQFLSPGSKLQAILSAERPDLVEICDKYTLNYLGPLLRHRLLSSLDFRPIVIGLSCERMDDNVRTYIGKVPLAKRFCAVYMKWLYFPFFDYHIANSQYTAEELRFAADGQLIERGTWIRPMGVNLSHLSPTRRSSTVRKRLLQNTDSNESVLLLYVGRLVPEKNLELLFKLFEHLVNTSQFHFRLIVVGDGLERHRWESAMTQRAPGRARFLGHVSDHELLADLYANADLFIHPNPREPFGIAPLEAMASGLPLIAPNSGGIKEYANSENAWLVEPTVASFAQAVNEALSNPSRRVEKVKAAVDTASRYDWALVASSFLDLYRDLHRVAEAHEEFCVPPAFLSVPAAGFQLGLMNAASKIAEGTFRCMSRIWSVTRDSATRHRGRAPACH